MAAIPGTRVIVDATGRPKIRRLRIEVRKGPNKGYSTDLGVDPIRIGTSLGCDVQLADTSVSGVHAELARAKYGVLLRDLGSTNGTYVDGRRIESLYIGATAKFSCGESELRVSLCDEETPVEISADDRFGDLIGVSVAMRSVFAKLKKIAASDATVLVTGETGTGKELVASAVRDNSQRQSAPFVVVDCGAMPANLIESELFGHERGAFTGADRARAGAFERASGGTIFLDEIGELPLSLQPVLLGILERREVRRVGGSKTIPIDVRVIAATNRNLATEVTRGAFRADLFYRLAVVEMRMPPLREHIEDLPMLIEHFLGLLPGERPTLGPETMAQLGKHSWPGNVRELKNVIERAALLAEAPSLQQMQTPSPKQQINTTDVDIEVPFKELKAALLGSFEVAYVTQLLENTGGNIAAAARKARIDRMYLYKLIDRYHIDVKKT